MPAIGDPAYPPICPRRTVFDKILVDAAREAGAEVRESFSFDDVIWEDGRVVGITGHTRDGHHMDERARIVVGADGKHSRVAEKVQAPKYNVVPGATCGYYSYWSGFEGRGTEVYVQGGRGIFVFQTNDGLTCAGTEWPKAEFEKFREDPEGNMLATFDRIPGLGERARKATRVEKIYGSAGDDSYYRKPYGPGWALAGDSGYMRDPILGQGMTDSFRDVEMLSAALDAGFSGRQPLDEALAGYEAQRNAATAMIYQVTNLITSTMDPDPEMMKMMRVQMQQRNAAAASAAGA